MSNLKQISIVSLSIFASRVLGLARDILFFSFLGTSIWASAFIFAFTLPNLFRRLFGEGAMTSALIPLFSESMENGKSTAFLFLNKVLSRIACILSLVVILLILILGAIFLGHSLPERWILGSTLGMIIMPYMLFICLAALVAAVLNVLEAFGTAAISAVWLNICMIGALLAGKFWGKSEKHIVLFLCFGVLLGGILQLIFPARRLKKEGWNFSFDLTRHDKLSELNQLLLPGLFGAAIFQVNILISRLLAFTLDNSAVSLLYLSNRLIELPLGMFAIAITTVIFPKMARLMAKGDFQKTGSSFNQGIRLILAITLPASAGLILLGRPILTLFFEWGQFGVHDVDSTLPVLQIFALALPLYALSTLFTRGFHSMKDMQTPVRIAACVLVANIGFAIGLMHLFGVLGLAWANVLSSILQVGSLYFFLRKKHQLFGVSRVKKDFFKILLSLVTMVALIIFAMPYLQNAFVNQKYWALANVIGLIPLSAILYGFTLYIFRFKDLSIFFGKQ